MTALARPSLRRTRARLVLATIDVSRGLSWLGQKLAFRGLREDAVGTVAVLAAWGLLFVTRGLDRLAVAIGTNRSRQR